jgi:hypothetical protein
MEGHQMFYWCIPALPGPAQPVIPVLSKVDAIDGQGMASAFRAFEFFVNNQSVADLFRSLLVLAVAILLLSELLNR